MELSAAELRRIARELLYLDLDERDAEACVRSLHGLHHAIRHLDQVPLPFNEGVFTEPAHGNRWLEDWDTPGAAQ